MPFPCPNHTNVIDKFMCISCYFTNHSSVFCLWNCEIMCNRVVTSVGQATYKIAQTISAVFHFVFVYTSYSKRKKKFIVILCFCCCFADLIPSVKCKVCRVRFLGITDACFLTGRKHLMITALKETPNGKIMMNVNYSTVTLTISFV